MKLARIIVIAVVALLVGWGGYRLGRSRERALWQNSIGDIRLGPPVADAIRPAPQGRSVEPPNHEPKSDTATAGAARLRLLKQLQQEGVLHRHLDFIRSDGTVSDGFVELADLTAAERAEMQAILDRARRRIDELILANAVFSQVSVESFKISIQPFEKGAEVYDQMMESLRTTLGEERYPVFASLTGETLAKFCDNYGAEQRTLTLYRHQRHGQDTLGLVEHRKGLRSESKGQHSLKQNELPVEYRWLSRYAQEIEKLPVMPRDKFFDPYNQP